MTKPKNGTMAHNSACIPNELNITSREIPPDVKALGDFVGRCNGESKAVYPAGGGTSLSFGRPGSRPGILLDTTRLDRIIDYPADDMTITVEAGIRMAALANTLAANGQMLPIDVANANVATLGGVIAANASGPRRFDYGTLRDYVLGIDVIAADGTRVHGGGRVVKNVAGYDLMKLHIGALGTLGIVVEATLKLRPVPEGRAAVVIACTTAETCDLLNLLANSATRPVAVELLNLRAAMNLASLSSYAINKRLVVVLFEESTEGVEWQRATLDKEIRALLPKCDVSQLTDPEYPVVLHDLINGRMSCDRGMQFKASILPSQVPDFIDNLERHLPGVEILSHALNGIVDGRLEKEEASDVSLLINVTAQVGGHVVFKRLPLDLKLHFGPRIWGGPIPGELMMRRIKREFDPNNILNPGRFLFD